MSFGNLEQAVQSLEHAQAVGPPNAFYAAALANAWVTVGRTADAQALLEVLERRRETQYVSATTIGLIHLVLGDLDSALKWMETAYEERDTILSFIHRGNMPLVLPTVELPLREHPQWLALMSKLNLA